MTEEVKKAPTPEELKQAEEAAKAEAEKKAKEEAEAKAEAEAEAKEATLGETFKGSEDKTPKEEPRLVPEAVLLEYKNQNKELRKDIKELRELIETGASKKEVSEDLEKIAEEYGLDVDYLTKLVKSIRGQVEMEMASKIKPIQDRENQERIEKAFNEHFNQIIETMPEYKDIVDKEAIKKLSLLPENQPKTLRSLIEATYGKALESIPGRKTMESAKGGKQEKIEEIDFNKARNDLEYFNEIMTDPILKAKYNANIEKRIDF